MTPSVRRLLHVVLLVTTPVAAGVEEFKCPDGAKDSGAVPHQIVRWCEIANLDGRLVYHGPVWRWHRNGQFQSKERYVYGNMEGEVPSWFENGTPSSLGSLKAGKRVGLWKFWDEQGRIQTEVTYVDGGASQVTFFPSGGKKASGTFHDGAKLGLWVYFNEDGSEKARCDFGAGLLALPKNKGCRIIADELEPIGFSRPAARGRVRADGTAVISVGPQSYTVTVPPGWTSDANAGLADRAPLVFFLKGGAWRQSGPNMYIRPLFKEGRSLKSIVDDERQGFASEVAQYKEGPFTAGNLGVKRGVVAKMITYKPVMQTDSPFSVVQDNTIHEAVGFLDVSPEVVLMIVLTANDEKQLKASLASLTVLIESIRFQRGG